MCNRSSRVSSLSEIFFNEVEIMMFLVLDFIGRVLRPFEPRGVVAREAALGSIRLDM